VALPTRDTIKRVDPASHRISATLERGEIWQAQTPQTFRRERLTAALEAALRDGITGTDEAFFLERLGDSVYVVEGSPTNIKITTPDDWVFAEALYRQRKK
jgi:2-C-methyl-D-erythritol 4-phosphate cytidylyltransferase